MLDFRNLIPSIFLVGLLFSLHDVDNSIGDKGLEVIASTLRRQNPSPCPVLREFNVSCRRRISSEG